MILFFSNCIKIERLLRENCKNPVVGDVSLTGAIGDCSSYQQPGRRRGLAGTGAITTQANLAGFAAIMMLCCTLLFTFNG
jgi:hypothetical protein